MALAEKQKLLAELSPPLDHLLCTQFLDEFISAERRYIQRDWEPTQLDGGQFAEATGRIWYSADSGNVNRNKDLTDCITYLENDKVTHAIVPRHDAIHVGRVLRTLYKFRSQRGAVHISPNYTPNHMDSKFVMECVRWLMNESLRVFWRGDREAVAKTIRELLQFDVPAVGIFKNEIIVQRTDLSAEEEVLILLHFAGEDGFNRTTLGKAARLAPSTVTETLQKLCSPRCREIIVVNGNYRLTDLGSRRVREQLAPKLLVG